MTIGQRIKDLRLQNRLTQEDVANYIGVAIQTIYKYENGIVTNIPSDKIELMAKVLKTTPAYIMGWKTATSDDISSLSKYGIHPIKTKKFPMLGKIACGKPIYCNEDYETFVEASSDINADFCLLAKGDSMINARIYDGDVVFIRSTPEVLNGEIAAVVIEDEITLKRVYYYKKENKLVLAAENPKYAPLVYVNEELNHINILGRAVAFMSDVR